MKAWDDLVNNKELSLWTTDDSEWYLDTGAKIERFNDGRIVIKNVLSRGDNFTDPTVCQMYYFENSGWDAGRYKICVDEYRRRIKNDWVSGDDTESLEAILSKFEIKLEKALQGL